MVKRFTVFILLTLLPIVLFAGTVGKVSGRVTDSQSGEPLHGANVIIKGTSIGAATDEDGQYYLFNVPPGIYELLATYIGYTNVTVQNVRVTVDITTDVDFEMRPSTIEGEEVVVIAKKPLIEKKATNERRVVRAEDIENLPVRGAQDIVGLQTGAVKVGNNLYVRGGRFEEVVYYVDGVYQVNDYNRNMRPEAGEVSSSALEEVSFQAGGFDAEYGSATSGIINMSTKTGGDRFRLSTEVITDEFLNKDDDNILGTYSYGYNLYNLTASGPITDNISFFVNGERQFERDRRTFAGPHPEGTWLGDLDGNGYATYDEYEVVSAYGPAPYNSEGKWMGAGNLLFNFHPFKLKVGGNATIGKWRQYDGFSHDLAAYAAESMPLYKSQTYSGYARLTWTINEKTLLNTQLSVFQDNFQHGHPELWDDFMKYGIRRVTPEQYADVYGGTIADTAKYGYEIDDDGQLYILINPAMQRNGANPQVSGHYADFYAPGTVYGNGAINDFEKNSTGYVGFNADLKSQVGNHELKFGAEYRDYTVRYYRLGDPMRVAPSYFNTPPYEVAEYDSLYSLNHSTVSDFSTYDAYVENYWFQIYKNALASNIGYSIDGKELLDEGRDGPRTPKVAGLFFQDKLELKDLVVNFGWRYDYIDVDNYIFRDQALIVLDSTGRIADNVYMDEDGEYSSYEPTYDLDHNLIDGTGRTQLVEREPWHLFSPRLGLAFPVTDKTVFHAQYGKYVQQPEFRRMFLSYTDFASDIGQGNFTLSGNPNLNPVRTTSYEIGAKQQIGLNSSIDVTVFYKQMTDYIQVRNVAGARPVVYAQFVNGDYGSVKGLSFAYNLRRTGYVSAAVNYTLQYAAGTGSTGNGQYRIAWQSGNYPSYVSPLDFDQRHTGNVNIDFRTTANDFIKEFGANLLFTFGSGRRYTPVVIDSYCFPSTSDTPIAGVNSGIKPWVFQFNLKLDKNYRVGPTKINCFVIVQNLFNRINVRDVHDGTGLYDYDGFLNTDAGKIWASNPNNNVDIYNMRMMDPTYTETPRTIRLGVKIELD